MSTPVGPAALRGALWPCGGSVALGIRRFFVLINEVRVVSTVSADFHQAHGRGYAGCFPRHAGLLANCQRSQCIRTSVRHSGPRALALVDWH